MKTFYTQGNIGKVKYVVCFHDEESTHNDGSPFFGIKIFKNKKKLSGFIANLQKTGYNFRRP